MHFLCPEPHENQEKYPEIVLKVTKNLVLKFHFLLLGPLVYVDSPMLMAENEYVLQQRIAK